MLLHYDSLLVILLGLSNLHAIQAGLASANKSSQEKSGWGRHYPSNVTTFTASRASSTSSTGHSTTLSRTPWPRSWPFNIHQSLSNFPGFDEALPDLKHVIFRFERPGRQCSWRGQRIIFDHAHDVFIEGWPGKTPIGGFWYEQHNRAFDPVLRLMFQESHSLSAHPQADELWILAESAVEWLKSWYDEKGCRASVVEIIADWGTYAITLGEFHLTINEPPHFDPAQRWPEVSRLPFRTPIHNEHDAGTYLGFLSPANPHYRFNYWVDPDPFIRQWASKMFYHATEDLGRLRHRGEDVDVYDFQTEAEWIDYFAYFITPGAVHGEAFWPKHLVANILLTLMQLVHQRGIVSVVVNVHYQGRNLGSIEFGSYEEIHHHSRPNSV